jgi:MFS family permease
VSSRNSSLLRVSALLGTAANSGVNIAIPWLVLEITGSSAQAGLVLGLSSLSVVISAPLIGGLIAVVGAKRVSVTSDVISCASVALLPIIDTAIGLSFLSLLVIATFGAIFDPAGLTARKTMIQRVAETEQRSLQKLNGSFEASIAIGWIVGPAVTALCIGALGINAALTVIAITSALAAFSVFAMSLEDIRTSTPERPNMRNVWRETVAGVVAMWGDKPLLSLFGLYTLLTALYMPVESVVLSRHFKDLGQPESFGILLSAMAVGVVLGALIFHRAMMRFSPPQLVVASMSTIGLVVCAMALLPGTLVFALLGFALGLAYGPVSPLSNYLVQRRIPQHLQGAVYGAQFSLTHLAMPIGTLALGFVIESVSIPVTMFTVGALFTLVTLVVGIWGPMRHLTATETPS